MENLASRTIEAQGRRPSLETIRLRTVDLFHINISFCIFVHWKQFEEKGFLSQVTQAMEKENTADNIDGEVEERVRSDSTTSGIFPKNVPKMCHYKEMEKRV